MRFYVVAKLKTQVFYGNFTDILFFPAKYPAIYAAFFGNVRSHATFQAR